MLRSTFQHVGGFGPSIEASLWRLGLRDWREVPPTLATLGLGAAREAECRRDLEASERALAERDAGWFARRLPPGEHWRLYPEFEGETAFLDIETTSLSPYEGIVTVVSVHAHATTRTFTAEDDLEELPAYLRRFPVLVTFNGRLFDVPFLAVRFPDLVEPPAHIDLRYLFYRLGHGGGLKRIEARLGLGEREGVEGIRGLDAVRLWQAHRRGEAGALERLVQYNRADTRNLEPLLRFAVREMTSRLLGPAPALARSAPGA